MLNKIINYSLHNRLIIMVSTILLILAGSYVASDMEVDVFPDLNAPTVVVMTEAHGMAPEEVEKLVSFPIETAINGSTGLRRVRSSSAMGFSIVWAEFNWGMDVYDARQIISEKLMTVGDQLPEGVEKPVLAPQSSLMGEIMVFAITSDSVSPMELRTIAEWNIRPQLLSVGGVAQVTIIGGDLKEYQILANPDKMRYYDVSFEDLIAATEASNRNVPGGFINEHGNEYLVRGIGRTRDLEEMGNTIIRMDKGYPVKVNDVAKIVMGAAPRIGTGSYRAKDAVVLTVTKQPDVNTLELTKKIKNTIGTITRVLPPGVEIHTDVFDQSEFISTSINNVQRALIEGSLFVVIILALFLMNYRTTVISLLAIPLSLLVTIITLKLMGLTINTMSLGGMAIAIGSLVDDAIIDVENVYKRLRQNAGCDESARRPVLKVIYEASTEIRASIMNATLIIIVAFVPLFFLSGMEGRMLRPLGIAYIVSLFASLLVAITLTPTLCSILLVNQRQLLRHQQGSWVERKLNVFYEVTLKRIMEQRKLVIGVCVVLFVMSLWLLGGFGRSFLPPFNEGTLTINLSTLPGISLPESHKIGQEAEQQLLLIPEINSVERRTGRAELAEHSFGANVSEIDAPFTLHKRSRNDFLKEVRAKLGSIKGVNVEVGQPISHRMNHMLSGSRASIAIKLFGTELGRLYEVAREIESNIQDVEGVTDLQVEQQVEIPQIQIKPRRDMLAKYGISMNHFTRFIDYAFAGEKVGDVFEAERSFAMILRYDDEYRDRLEAIQNALIDAGDGRKIPLQYVAEIVSSSGPNTVSRENVQRKIVISANVADRDIRSVVNDIQQRIDSRVTLPENYWLTYGGQFESEAQASRILLFASLFSLLIIYLLLHQEFKQTRITNVVMLNLPLALIGGVLAIQFSSGVLSIPSIIGFITLFGIATRNGILLVSRYQHLKEEGMGLMERIISGSRDRLNPILMTALTAALALIPLAMAGDQPGNEIQSPMAVVILGGLLSSTLLNVYVIPVIYYLINRKEVQS